MNNNYGFDPETLSVGKVRQRSVAMTLADWKTVENWAALLETSCNDIIRSLVRMHAMKIAENADKLKGD